jgi:NADH-quinone oxidoreductase subunit C
MSKQVLDTLAKKFGDAVIDTRVELGDATAQVDPAKLVEIATFLRDDPAMAFDMPVFCTCNDRLGEEPRFEVFYALRSVKHKHRLRLVVRVPEGKPEVPSLCGLWRGFDWLERETYDMYGIQFTGHPDLRRLYMYDEFEGHPLRKDYPKDKRQPLVRRDFSTT